MKTGIESFENRLKRFLYSGPDIFILTLTNSIDNLFLPELKKAKELKLTQLLFLGAHAIMQTVSEAIYDKKQLKGTQFFLKNFVDGSTSDRQFSLIADELHRMRNVSAHQWLSRRGHRIFIDFNMAEGWKRNRGMLHINPNIFADQFFLAFSAKSQYWTLWEQIPEQELTLRKYKYICGFLDLKASDQIVEEVRKLKPKMTKQAFAKRERMIQQKIATRFGIAQAA